MSSITSLYYPNMTYSEAVARDGEKAEKIFALQRSLDEMKKSAEEAPTRAKITVLNSLLRQCETVNSLLYTGRSWNGLMRAYASGKSISTKRNMKAGDIQKIISQLLKAFNGLEPMQRKPEHEEDEERLGFPLVQDHRVLEQGAVAADGACAEGPVVSIDCAL